MLYRPLRSLLSLIAFGLWMAGTAPGGGVSSVAAATDVVISAGDAGGYEIVINIPAFTLYLYRHGVSIQEYPIGVGADVSPSKLGRTEIVNRVVDPTYYPPNWWYDEDLTPIPAGPKNPVGTRWLGLGWSGYGIHGTNAPRSIGTATSAGCIRMHNRDVEELAELVGPGTPVTFLYETVITWMEPLTGRGYVKIYPDVYNMGTNTVQHALDALARRAVHIPHVDRPALQALLEGARGRAYAVPQTLPVYVNEEELPGAGVVLGGKELIALDVLAAHLGEDLL